MAIAFGILGSSGATNFQVSEFQPQREVLQTQYFMFGQEFEPSNWLQEEKHYRTDLYNPINDLLNPQNVSPDEILAQNSKEYMEEQVLRNKFDFLREKQKILSIIPENLRTYVEGLINSGAIGGGTVDSELVDSVITQYQAQGSLNPTNASALRRLLERKGIFLQAMAMARQQANQGELEGHLNSVSSTIMARGLSAQTARALTRASATELFDLPEAGSLNPQELSDRLRQLAVQSADRYAESIGSGTTGTEEFEDAMGNPGGNTLGSAKDSGILAGSQGFGYRGSSGLGDGVQGDVGGLGGVQATVPSFTPAFSSPTYKNTGVITPGRPMADIYASAVPTIRPNVAVKAERLNPRDLPDYHGSRIDRSSLFPEPRLPTPSRPFLEARADEMRSALRRDPEGQYNRYLQGISERPMRSSPARSEGRTRTMERLRRKITKEE